MAEINYTPEFKRNYKKLKRKHYNINKLKKVIKLLEKEQFVKLKRSYDDHGLHGNLEGLRSLHVENGKRGNWILIYRIRKNSIQLIVIDLIATGNHDFSYRQT